MNRYPWWKYALLGLALLIGLLFTAPNFFGEAPAVQVSAGKSTVRVDNVTVGRVQQALKEVSVVSEQVQFDGNSVRARFKDNDTQVKAKDTELGSALVAESGAQVGDLRDAVHEHIVATMYELTDLVDGRFQKSGRNIALPELQLGYAAVVVPEPGTAFLLGMGLTALAAGRKRTSAR